jgi:NADH-quinone oxidoreductase subunit L
MAVAAAEVAVGLAILVSIFRNLGSIDINKLKLKRINYNEYKFSFTLIISSFSRIFYLIFSSEKYWKNLLEFLGLLWLLFRLVLHYTFFGQISVAKTPIQIQLFDWIQINNFNVDFGFLLDQLSILWLLFVTGIGSLIHLYSISYA